MDLTDVMDLWFQNEDVEENDVTLEVHDTEIPDTGVAAQDERLSKMVLDDSIEQEETEEEDTTPDNWLVAYRDFISNTQSYRWLIAQLEMEFRLSQPDPNIKQTIHDTILAALPNTNRISKSASSHSMSARFKIEWDIVDFFATQGYSNTPQETLERVIVLVGSSREDGLVYCTPTI